MTVSGSITKKIRDALLLRKPEVDQTSQEGRTLEVYKKKERDEAESSVTTLRHNTHTLTVYM